MILYRPLAQVWAAHEQGETSGGLAESGCLRAKSRDSCGHIGLGALPLEFWFSQSRIDCSNWHSSEAPERSHLRSKNHNRVRDTLRPMIPRQATSKITD